MEEVIFFPSDFVAVLNQTLEFAYPSVLVQGELSNLRVSKNRWVYFDLKDDYSSVKFFGTVYQLPGPLEDGMLVQVRGLPRLHQQYGFSVNVQFVQPVGEGSIKKASALLEAKLAAEGLFSDERKRPLPYPPQRIGLVASGESAAYHDFIKILNERWGGVEILHADVQVQGEMAVGQIVRALDHLNIHDDLDVIVITRGGGSADDLAAFSTEQVTRAVAASRTPTIVAIGHEVDFSLAELAADQRASTPSNAAQLLVPDKNNALEVLRTSRKQLTHQTTQTMQYFRDQQEQAVKDLVAALDNLVTKVHSRVGEQARLLSVLSPEAALRRGYAIIRHKGKTIASSKQVKAEDELEIKLHDGSLSATVKGTL